ncbi:MAG: hypothetical protein ABFD09_11265 [Proteiniphilum sp.]
MKIFISAIIFFMLSTRLYTATGSDDVIKDYKYIIISINAGSGDEDVKKIASLFPPVKDARTIVGIGTIISYLSTPPEVTVKKLKNFLKLAEQNNLPVVIELDGINWWQARPDLWNWWDKNKPGYNPDNKKNVEWTGWTPDLAVKIGWRNWGRQLRIDPMPNLMSPAYLEACHKEINRLIPVILDWWHELPVEKKNLLVSVQIGVECSIGANNWYYPNGNNLADKPEKDDPSYGLNHDVLPGRGVQPIGYAAVSTLGLAKSGELKEEDVTKVVYKYVFDLCKIASDLGVPRDHLFTHAGGWKEGESVYFAGLNPYSCPGWSFYTFAKDPAEDKTAMEAVKKSDAPYWGAVEWLLFNVKEQGEWEEAYHNIFAIPRLRYVQVRHWGSIKNNPVAIQAIQNVIK